MNLNSESITQFLAFFIIGLLLALIVQFLSQKLYGRFLKALFEAGANDKIFAKTLEELGFEKKKLIALVLRRKNTLTFIVEKIEEDGVLRYYIPEEKSEKAKALCRSDGFSVITVILLAAGIAAIYFLCKYALPLILK